MSIPTLEIPFIYFFCVSKDIFMVNRYTSNISVVFVLPTLPYERSDVFFLANNVITEQFELSIFKIIDTDQNAALF